MSWKLEIKSSAKREIRRLPNGILKRIVSKINGLKENPYPEGTIKLMGMKGYRIRTGAWRILYEIDQQKRLVIIFAVRHRSKAYK